MNNSMVGRLAYLRRTRSAFLGRHLPFANPRRCDVISAIRPQIPFGIRPATVLPACLRPPPKRPRRPAAAFRVLSLVFSSVCRPVIYRKGSFHFHLLVAKLLRPLPGTAGSTIHWLQISCYGDHTLSACLLLSSHHYILWPSLIFILFLLRLYVLGATVLMHISCTTGHSTDAAAL